MKKVGRREEGGSRVPKCRREHRNYKHGARYGKTEEVGHHLHNGSMGTEKWGTEKWGTNTTKGIQDT